MSATVALGGLGSYEHDLGWMAVGYLTAGTTALYWPRSIRDESRRRSG